MISICAQRQHVMFQLRRGLTTRCIIAVQAQELAGRSVLAQLRRLPLLWPMPFRPITHIQTPSKHCRSVECDETRRGIRLLRNMSRYLNGLNLTGHMLASCFTNC